MTQAALNIRIDADLKSRWEAVCSELGIDVTTAVTMLAKKMVREQRIPFEAEADPFCSSSNLRHLREGIKALNAGKGVEHDLLED